MTNINENNSTTDSTQSHWGSGVNLTVVSLTKKPAPVPPAVSSGSKMFSVWVLLLGFAVSLPLGFVCLRAGANAKSSLDEVNAQLSKDSKIMYGDKHVVETRVIRIQKEFVVSSMDKENPDRAKTIIHYPEYVVQYDPPWVALFGNMTKGKNYSGLRFDGTLHADTVYSTYSSISQHIFDGCDFDDAVITGFVFDGCSFKNARFCRTQFKSVTMNGCDFTGALFSETLFERHLDPCQIDNPTGLTWDQIKKTRNYTDGRLSNSDIVLPPDIKKALEKEQKQKDTQ